MFFSTHVLDVAEKICDRVGIIVKGKLVTSGTIEEVKAQANDESLEDAFLAVAGEGFTIAENNDPPVDEIKSESNEQTSEPAEPGDKAE